MTNCGADIVITAKLQKRPRSDKEIRTASRGYSAYNELYHMLGSKANKETMLASIWIPATSPW
jgi:hypothetical protein